MNYPAMRWAVEECRLEGAAKPILFVIAYHADRDTGEAWAGQRRIARAAGVDPKTVERIIPKLIKDGVLELVERSRGPRPHCYRIAPAWVEPVEEVIHSPAPTADIVSALGVSLDRLVPTLDGASADIGRSLVPTLGNESADSQVPLSSENAGKGLNFKGLERREVQVLGGGSTADAAAAEVAYTPSEVSDADKAYLRERFGPRRPPPKSKSGQEQEPAEGVQP